MKRKMRKGKQVFLKRGVIYQGVKEDLMIKTLKWVLGEEE